MKDIILRTDSYKTSHWMQFPSGTENTYYYLESRGGLFSETVFFGLQYIIKEYLAGRVITEERIDRAEEILKAHGLPFNRAGWEHIIKKHSGRLPVRIKAVPEGTVVPTHNVLLTIENTDPECYWLPGYLETLLVQLWYPITVATLSREIKKTIHGFLEDTGDVSGIDFKLHDFGFRGVSSVESAGIGGAAHLVNFKGTDTMEALLMVMGYYEGDEVPGFSIPASEHSTITSWGKDGELAAFENMLDKYKTGLVACVSDSYNVFRACSDLWGDKLREKILGRDGCLVIRLDSGDPIDTVCKSLDILTGKFGFNTNDKGYKVLPPQVRILQGDGVNKDSIKDILQAMKNKGYSADNIAFGMGGALLQKLNRDTQKFAMKLSSVIGNYYVDEMQCRIERDCFKDPETDPGKRSKSGRFKLVWDRDKLKTVPSTHHGYDILEEVFLNGWVTEEYKFEDIRYRARI